MKPLEILNDKQKQWTLSFDHHIKDSMSQPLLICKPVRCTHNEPRRMESQE